MMVCEFCVNHLDRSSCAVYLIRCSSTGDVKIGLSSDPNRRMREVGGDWLGHGGPMELLFQQWFCCYVYAHGVERFLHNKYATRRVSRRAEWFKLTLDEQMEAVITLLRLTLEAARGQNETFAGIRQWRIV